MNINRDDLKSLQSAYRTVLTESSETGYNGGMNNTNQTENMLDLKNHQQYEKEIFMTFDDDGDWEQTRLGFGEDASGRLYLVDLEDSNERFREKMYIKAVLSATDVIAEGLAHKVFVKDDEDDIDEDVRVTGALYGGPAWDKFLKVVLEPQQ